MTFIRALRALVRVEARGLRRDVGRTWLVVLLVAVPVAAMVGGGALFATIERTPDEARAQLLGAADLRIEDVADVESARALVPSAARIAIVQLERAAARVPGRRVAARAYRADAAAFEVGGLAHGFLAVTEGRAPNARDEVAIAPVLARALDRAIGDAVEVDGVPCRVTGIVVEPEDLAMPVLLRVLVEGEAARGAIALLEAADSDAVAGLLRAAGRRVIVRSEIGARDDFESAAVLVLGGFGVFVAGLVISAAFAVGVRRRQREIGLLASCGASVASLRAASTAATLALASVGAAIGIAVGLGSAHALAPFLDGWNQRVNGPVESSWAHVAAAAALGLAGAASASVLPTFGATRLPIRVALSGRRPVIEGTRAWTAVGVALVAVGFGLVAWGTRLDDARAAIAILAGSILGVLGLGAASPWLLGGLAHVAAPLPLAWRLAARDAGRFRARNAPVVAAVLAGMSVSLTIAALIGSIEALVRSDTASMRTDQIVVDGPGAEDAARAIERDLGAVAIAPLAAARVRGDIVRVRLDDGARSTWLAFAAVDTLLAFDASSGHAALAAGRVVMLVDRDEPIASGRDELTLVTETGAEIGTFPVARVAVDEVARGPVCFVGAELLDLIGAAPGAPPDERFVPWTVRTPAHVDADVVERARSIASTVPGSAVDAAVLRTRESSSIFLVVLGLCFATGIVVVLVATSLSSVESAADARVLRAVGAAPGVMRAHAAARAAYLALLGCVLAVPAGLVPSYGLVALSGADLEFRVPWTAIAVVVCGLPAIASGCAWLHAAFDRTDRARVARA